MISKKRFFQFVMVVGILSTPMLYQNCAPSHGENSADFSSRIFTGAGACDQILIQGFEQYRNALQSAAMCGNCHQAGGTAGKPFADANMDVAFQSLFDEGETKIWEFATEEEPDGTTHRAGFTGEKNIEGLTPHHDAYEAAQGEYSVCITESGNINEPPGGGYPTPTIKSADVALPDAADILDNPQELSFVINGIDITLEISAWETPQGNRGYDIRLPTVAAGAQTAYVKNMGLYFNGVFLDTAAGSAFQNADRYIAAGTTRALFATGVMNVDFNTLGANTLAVAFEVINSDPNVNFTPQSYQQLVNGVFAQSCNGCHAGAAQAGGGIAFDNVNTFSINYLNGLFIPFLTESQILESVELDRMPPNAPLNAADKGLVRGWILDGARRN